MTTITNSEGKVVTRIDVAQVITYDVETIVEQLLEDNRGDDGVEISFDDVLEHVKYLAGEDFAWKVVLSYKDENGNDY
jgi:nitrogen-specific signal transduction histidine kinase